MSNCVKCAGCSILCYSCENRFLRKEITKLQQQLEIYTNTLSEELDLKYWQLMDIKNTFERSNTSMRFDYKHRLSTCKFITLTFDPAKFGIQPLHDERKNYILSKLYRLIKSSIVIELYGSFEYTKAGIVHAHLIANTNFTIEELTAIIKPYFTDNPYNTKAVDIGPAKYPQAEEYINKESDDYFRYLDPKTKSKEFFTLPQRIGEDLSSGQVAPQESNLWDQQRAQLDKENAERRSKYIIYPKNT